jgi:hypothetical protein
MKAFLKKLLSIKVWIALWSLFLISYVVVNNLGDFNNLAMALVVPVIGYLGANVWQDKIYTSEERSTREDQCGRE